MKRIIVIGSAGAGKTTLSKALSARLGIPHTELDSLYHQPGWQPLPGDVFVARILKLSEASEWIFCGNYYTRLGQDVWPRADTIIWCNYSFLRVLSRLLRRTIQRGVSKEELWNGNQESLWTSFFTKDSIILWMLKSWKKQNIRYGQLYAQPEKLSGVTLVRLKTPRATRAFLASLD